MSQDATAKQVCLTGKDGRIESGRSMVGAAIIEPEGESNKILRVTLPLGMQLAYGTRLIVGKNTPQQNPYVGLLRQWLHVGLCGDARSDPKPQEGAEFDRSGDQFEWQAIDMVAAAARLRGSL